MQVPGAVQLPWSQEGEHTAGQDAVQEVVSVQCVARGGRYACAPQKLDVQSSAAASLHKSCKRAKPAVYGRCYPPGELHTAPSQPDSHVQVSGAVHLPLSHAEEHTAAWGAVQMGYGGAMWSGPTPKR